MEEALRRGWEDLIGRLSGPMAFRLIFQPAMAALFAIRAGLQDAREDRPLFLRALFAHPAGRNEMLRQVRDDVGNVFILAILLDSIYQVMVHSSIYTLELLLTATILALLPYVVVRAVVRHLANRRPAASCADGRPGTQAELGEGPQRER